MNNNPIGVLDSGMGGSTILQAIVEELPHESYIYIGDSKNTPYGSKTAEEICYLGKQLVEFLLAKNVKLIVVACNTITVSCLEKLRNDYPQVPIIGTVPVIKTAAAISESKHIGILSTTRTAQSDYQKDLINTFAADCKVFNHGTDALVPLIEQGKLNSEEMTTALTSILIPFKEEGVDTLALGCTHFPLLRKQMEKILGPQVQLLDSGKAIAHQVRRVLTHNNSLAEKTEQKITIYTTGNMKIAKNLLPDTLDGQAVDFQQATIQYDH